MTDNTMLTTGELARRTDCHPDTIRAYCREGLLHPLVIDSAGRRLFSADQIPEVKNIRRGKARLWRGNR